MELKAALVFAFFLALASVGVLSAGDARPAAIAALLLLGLSAGAAGLCARYYNSNLLDLTLPEAGGARQT